MRHIGKLAVAAALAGGVALTATAPAQAGVSIGIGIGVPGPAHGPRWCYYHPGACPAAYVGTPVVGAFVGGRGWWDGHAWYHHRYWGHGGWRYR